jgi:hypothetical protein
MGKKNGPAHYISLAQRRACDGRKRIRRQRQRVARLQSERRDSTSAERLLQAFQQHQTRREVHLKEALQWAREYARVKPPQYLLGRPKVRRVQSEDKREKQYARWNKTVLEFLDRRFTHAPNYKESLIELWHQYVALGLPNQHFVTQFTGGKTTAVFQRSWEMMLARHLNVQGHRIITADGGPDFRIEYSGLTIWVEAISPEPMGIPQDWMDELKPGEVKVGDVPHIKILLRWTAAIKEKWEKLKIYRDKKIVRDGDAYVIAVNGCQLGRIPIQHGVSRYPYAVEAVYALGPIAIPIDKDTGAFGKPFVSPRSSIQSDGGGAVSTSLFIDPTYSSISAIIACSMDRSAEASLPLDIVHNQFARVPIPKRILGSKGEEWITENADQDGFDLRRLDDND